jgi:hypothetical protein
VIRWAGLNLSSRWLRSALWWPRLPWAWCFGNRSARTARRVRAPIASGLKPVPPEELLPPGPYIALTRAFAIMLRDNDHTPPLIREYLEKAIRWSEGK